MKAYANPQFTLTALEAKQQEVESLERRNSELRSVIDAMRVEIHRRDTLMDSMRDEIRRLKK